MTIVRYNPFVPGKAFQGLVDEFLGRDLNEWFKQNNGFKPAVNVKETDQAFQLELAAPGYQKENFEIGLDESRLTIKASREDQNKEENQDYRRREFYASTFERSFHLPENVDAEHITASYENGILVVEIPKKEEVKPEKRTIAIG